MRGMKYRLLVALVGAFCSLSCLSSDDAGPPPDGRRPRVRCEQLSSCATCTPVLGCGWCQSGDKGLCTSEPNRCADVETFSWTWELAFCPAELDGGADARGAAPLHGAPVSDGAAAPSDATAPDGAAADVAAD
jgi:hypothetical protein